MCASKYCSNGDILLVLEEQILKFFLTEDGFCKEDTEVAKEPLMLAEQFDELPLKRSYEKEKSGVAALFGGSKKYADEEEQGDQRFITLFDDDIGELEDSIYLALWNNYFELLCVIQVVDEEKNSTPIEVDKLVVVDHETIAVRNTKDHYFALYQLPSDAEMARYKDKIK